MIPKIKPNIEKKTPSNDARRRGLTEKAVKPFNHNENNFFNVYPDFPETRSLCSISTFPILSVALITKPVIYGKELLYRMISLITKCFATK